MPDEFEVDANITEGLSLPLLDPLSVRTKRKSFAGDLHLGGALLRQVLFGLCVCVEEVVVVVCILCVVPDVLLVAANNRVVTCCSPPILTFAAATVASCGKERHITLKQNYSTMAGESSTPIPAVTVAMTGATIYQAGIYDTRCFYCTFLGTL